ncbi:MAG: glutamate 5-kinase [Cyanobacteria bacterium P01_H01_bin.74]
MKNSDHLASQLQSQQQGQDDQEILQNANRIVIKLGSHVFLELIKNRDNALLSAEEKAGFYSLINQCVQLIQLKKQVILVSSGAVALGQAQLNLTETELSLSQKQACAAVGQTMLMQEYKAALGMAGLVPAQVLLTAHDFSDRKHYLSLQQTLESMLALNIVPIINENDVTSTAGIEEVAQSMGFKDNDMLSALVASRLNADLLVVLTNVKGIYTENPVSNSQAKPISHVARLTELDAITAHGQSSAGRGGMESKLEAVKAAARSGITTYITSGLDPAPLSALLPATVSEPNSEQEPATKPAGTLIEPANAMKDKQRWIGMASGYEGIIVVNDGAEAALRFKQASILPIGVVSVHGQFVAQQVISVHNSRGKELARGLSNFSSDEIEKMRGKQSQDIHLALGQREAVQRPEVIHRDDLVVFPE